MVNNTLVRDIADCTSTNIIKSKKSLVSQPKATRRSMTHCETLALLDSRLPDIDGLYGQLAANTIGYTIAPAHDALMVITLLLGETRATKLMIVLADADQTPRLGALPLDQVQMRAKSALLQEWAIKEVTFCCGAMTLDHELIAEFARLTGAKVIVKSDL